MTRENCTILTSDDKDISANISDIHYRTKGANRRIIGYHDRIMVECADILSLHWWPVRRPISVITYYQRQEVK